MIESAKMNDIFLFEYHIYLLTQELTEYLECNNSFLLHFKGVSIRVTWWKNS